MLLRVIQHASPARTGESASRVYHTVAELRPPLTYERLLSAVQHTANERNDRQGQTARMEASSSFTPSNVPSPKFQYRDADGDLITISSQKELSEWLSHQSTGRHAAEEENGTLRLAAGQDMLRVSEDGAASTSGEDDLIILDRPNEAKEHNEAAKEEVITLRLLNENQQDKPSSSLVDPFPFVSSVTSRLPMPSASPQSVRFQVYESPDADETQSEKDDESPDDSTITLEPITRVDENKEGAIELIDTSVPSMVDQCSFVLLSSKEAEGEHMSVVKEVENEPEMKQRKKQINSASATEADAPTAACFFSVILTVLSEEYSRVRGVVRISAPRFRAMQRFLFPSLCALLFVVLTLVLCGALGGSAAENKTVEQKNTAGEKHNDAIERVLDELNELKQRVAQREMEEKRWKEEHTVDIWLSDIKDRAYHLAHDKVLVNLHHAYDDLSSNVASFGSAIHSASDSIEQHFDEQMHAITEGVGKIVEAVRVPQPTMLNLGSVEKWQSAKRNVENKWNDIKEGTVDFVNDTLRAQKKAWRSIINSPIVTSTLDSVWQLTPSIGLEWGERNMRKEEEARKRVQDRRRYDSYEADEQGRRRERWY